MAGWAAALAPAMLTDAPILSRPFLSAADLVILIAGVAATGALAAGGETGKGNAAGQATGFLVPQVAGSGLPVVATVIDVTGCATAPALGIGRFTDLAGGRLHFGILVRSFLAHFLWPICAVHPSIALARVAVVATGYDALAVGISAGTGLGALLWLQRTLAAGCFEVGVTCTAPALGIVLCAATSADKRRGWGLGDSHCAVAVKVAVAGIAHAERLLGGRLLAIAAYPDRIILHQPFRSGLAVAPLVGVASGTEAGALLKRKPLAWRI